jgi:hypothetical protein
MGIFSTKTTSTEAQTGSSTRGFALILVGRIQIQESKMAHKNRKNLKISFYEVLDVIF